MSDSLTRFAPEQFAALLADLSQTHRFGEADETEEGLQIKRMVGRLAGFLGAALMAPIEERGHSVCCYSTALSLFATGFLYGWHGREALLDTEELENGIRDSGLGTRERTETP